MIMTLILQLNNQTQKGENMPLDLKQKALENFLRYVKIDTQANPKSDETPSSKKQFDLANILVKELNALGLSDVSIDDNCYVMATLPTATGKSSPAVGFIAHMDTAPDASGANVKPQIYENYQGQDLDYPGDSSLKLTVAENPELKTCIGHTIVTTDGTTLLGADDKAGIAAIMTMLEYFKENPNAPHPTIKICFTPDEEIGRGTKFFDIEKFGADFAYTIDGSLPGEINKETFSADSATVTIKGKNIHPGSAKNIMVNSMRALSEVIAKLPQNMAPETTEGYEPFIHPHELSGTVEESSCLMLFRGFDDETLVKEKEILEGIITEVKARYPNAEFELKVEPSYRNMKEGCLKVPQVLDILEEAAKEAGANPYWAPIRGGTDGSGLTAKGLPCPNIYHGGSNFHSRTEWLSADFLAMTVQTLINMAKLIN